MAKSRVPFQKRASVKKVIWTKSLENGPSATNFVVFTGYHSVAERRQAATDSLFSLYQKLILSEKNC